MHEQFSRRNLESLRKEAKRWLAALRHNDSNAWARLERASSSPAAPSTPTLRDVQQALAREHGFPGWPALKRALVSNSGGGPRWSAQYDMMAAALLEAYRTGTPDAMDRHYLYTWHRREWQCMRSYIQLDLGKRPSEPDADVEITIDDARYLVALEHGFASWKALKESQQATAAWSLAAKPVHVLKSDAEDQSQPFVSSRDWNIIIQSLSMQPSGLHAAGQMTDAILADISRVENVTALDLSGSKALTDEGVRHLARLPHLKHLDLSGTAVTDRGLAVLRELPALETISLSQTRITDAGAANLAYCDELRRVELQWTRTGEGAIRALTGKSHLSHLSTGHLMTDPDIALLREIPMFRKWHGNQPSMALMSYRCGPNYLCLRGSFTDRGVAHLRGLDGLFGLNLDDSHLALTSAALAPLVSLPNLGWLAVDAKDDWMPYIAEMPRLRFLGAQDTTAGDEGFVALSKSRSIEYIWGRRCHNLRRKGFVALANMPELQGLSVSCLNVDDAGIEALPSFPSLRELMPMDVLDAGYRHIGKCDRLQSLILMYCRDTTDTATEHITGLSNLSYYFNSYTTITDRTPELLSGMDALERVTFDTCHGLSDAGVAMLARLPKLRELRASGRNITLQVAAAFPPWVRVNQG